MSRKQQVTPSVGNGRRGWRPGSNYLASCALAFAIVLVLGGLFLSVMSDAPGQTERKYLNAQELVSTTIFAIVGVMAMRQAIEKLTVGNVMVVFAGCFATTNGGGTIRDLLLFREPFWASSWECLIIPMVVTALGFMVRPTRDAVVGEAVRLVDNFSTGVFIYVGIFKVVDVPAAREEMFLLAATFSGAMTAMAGGVIRDFLLLQRVPTAFRTMAFLNGVACSALLAFAIKLGLPTQFGLNHWVGWGWLVVGAVTLIVNELTEGRSFSYQV